MTTPAETRPRLRWVVGVGLRGHSRGAVLFGRWLQQRDGGDRDEFEVVHAVSSPDVIPLAERAIEETLTEHGLTGPHVHARVQDLGDPVVALADSCAAINAHAVIVGRRARIDSGGWPRLGRIGRRLLRSHPGPVFVVPPDWSEPTAGSGPVLCATDMSPDSSEAVGFTARLAAALQRPWVLAHVVPPPPPFTMYGLGAQPREDEQRKAEASKAMAEHVQEFPAAPALTRIVQGDVVNALLGLRDELSAPIIVTGSRRLSALGRLFSASVGTELAASSVCPVAVVPPDREHLATAPRLPRAF